MSNGEILTKVKRQ